MCSLVLLSLAVYIRTPCARGHVSADGDGLWPCTPCPQDSFKVEPCEKEEFCYCMACPRLAAVVASTPEPAEIVTGEMHNMYVVVCVYMSWGLLPWMRCVALWRACMHVCARSTSQQRWMSSIRVPRTHR
jgi:hypothetical protein